MKTCATIALLILLASSAGAGVIHVELTDGDFSSDPATPTPLAFSPGGNTIVGYIFNVFRMDWDYITFTIAPGQMLVALNFLVFTPEDIGFAAFNAGTTSFYPTYATSGNFLAGIHVSGADVGTDLMPLFVSRSVTTNSLPSPSLGPGDYCFMIQQTAGIIQDYTLEFVLTGIVPTNNSTWGAVKALYR
jgi:hypothetical protein